MMLMISIFLGALGLGALLWGLKNGLFDDPNKFLEGTKFDSEDDLKDAVESERKKKELLKKKREKGYMPPD